MKRVISIVLTVIMIAAAFANVISVSADGTTVSAKSWDWLAASGAFVTQSGNCEQYLLDNPLTVYKNRENPIADMLGAFGWAQLSDGAEISGFGYSIDGGDLITEPEAETGAMEHFIYDRAAELANAGFAGAQGYWIVFPFTELEIGEHNAELYVLDAYGDAYKLYDFPFEIKEFEWLGDVNSRTTGWWYNPLDGRAYTTNITFTSEKAFNGVYGFYFTNTDGNSYVTLNLLDEDENLLESKEIVGVGDKFYTTEFDSDYRAGTYTLQYTTDCASGGWFVIASANSCGVDVSVFSNAGTNENTLLCPCVALITSDAVFPEYALLNVSYDELFYDGASLLQMSVDKKIAALEDKSILDFNKGDVSEITIRGWARISEDAGDIAGFGYRIDKDRVVTGDFVEDRAAELEAAGFAGGQGFSITVPVSELDCGEHSIDAYLITNDGTKIKIYKERTTDETVVKNQVGVTFEVIDPTSVEPRLTNTCYDQFTVTLNKVLVASGWTGATYQIIDIGYTVDYGEPIFNGGDDIFYGFLTEVDDADPVKNPANGGKYGIRFSINANLTNLPEGEHRIGFVVKLADKDETVLEFGDYNVSNETVEPYLNAYSFNTVYLDDVIYCDVGDAAGYLKTNRIGGEYTTIGARGWAWIENAEIESFGYDIDGGEPVFDASFTQDREDVWAAFGVDKYVANGFCINPVYVDGLEEGKHTMTVYVKATNGTVMEITSFNFTKGEIIHATLKQQALDALYVDNDLYCEGNVEEYLADNPISGNIMNIGVYGWASIENGEIERFGFRIDGSNVFGEGPVYEIDGAYGYELFADVGDLASGEHTFTVFVYTTDGDFVDVVTVTFTAIRPARIKYSSFDGLYIDGNEYCNNGRAADYIKENPISGDYSTFDMRGWAWISDYDIDRFGYRIDNGHEIFDETFVEERPDVQQAFGVPAEQANGFCVTADLSGLVPGRHTMYILVRATDGTILTISNFRFTVGEVTPGRLVSREVNELYVNDEWVCGGNIDEYLENNTITGDINRLGIRGWAWIENADIESFGYKVDGEMWESGYFCDDPDVYEPLGVSMVEANRFDFSAYVEWMDIGNHVLTVFVHTTDDEYIDVVNIPFTIKRTASIYSNSLDNEYYNGTESYELPVQTVGARGWAFVRNGVIDSFGYKIDDGEPVFDASFTQDREDVWAAFGVDKTIANGYCIPDANVWDLDFGYHTFTVCVRTTDGDVLDVLSFDFEGGYMATPDVLSYAFEAIEVYYNDKEAEYYDGGNAFDYLAENPIYGDVYRIRVRGWARIDDTADIDSFGYKIDGTVRGQGYNWDRPDVQEEAGVSYLQLNGINISFWTDYLHRGEHTVTVFVRTTEGVNVDVFSFNFTIYKEGFIQSSFDKLGINSSTYGEGDNYMREDYIRIENGDKMYVLGWVMFEEGLEKIVYDVDGQRYECSDTYRDRADVARYLGIPEYLGEHTGFGLDEEMMELVGIDELENGIYDVKVIAVSTAGNEETIKEFKLAVGVDFPPEPWIEPVLEDLYINGELVPNGDTWGWSENNRIRFNEGEEAAVTISGKAIIHDGELFNINVFANGWYECEAVIEHTQEYDEETNSYTVSFTADVLLPDIGGEYNNINIRISTYSDVYGERDCRTFETQYSIKRPVRLNDHSLDAVFIDGEPYVNSGMAEDFIRQNPICGDYSALGAFGWAWIEYSDIDVFGYSIDGGEPVFDAAFTYDRPDVQNAFGIPAERGNGFLMSMDVSELSEGRHTARILVRTTDGETVEVTSFKFTKGELLPAEIADYEVEAFFVNGDEYGRGNIEEYIADNPIKKDLYYIGARGWALIANGEINEFGYRISGEGYDDTGYLGLYHREDKEREFNATQEEVAEFNESWIWVEYLPYGEYDFTIFARTYEGAELDITTIHFRRDDESYLQNYSFNTVFIDNSVYCDIGDAKGYLSENPISGDYSTIGARGWAWVGNDEIAEFGYKIDNGETVFDYAYTQDRPDVQAAFGVPASVANGFNINPVDVTGLEPGYHRMTVYVKTVYGIKIEVVRFNFTIGEPVPAVVAAQEIEHVEFNIDDVWYETDNDAMAFIAENPVTGMVNRIEVHGWAYVKNADIDGFGMKLITPDGDVRISNYFGREERYDVCEELGVQSYEAAGYNMSEWVEWIDNGEYTVVVFARTDAGEEIELYSFPITLRNERLYLLEIEDINVGNSVYDGMEEFPSRIYEIEKGGKIYIQGYAGYEYGLDKLVVRINGEDYVYDGEFVDRFDLDNGWNYFGDYVFEKCGFGTPEQMLELPGISELEDGLYDVEIWVVSKTEEWEQVKSFSVAVGDVELPAKPEIVSFEIESLKIYDDNGNITVEENVLEWLNENSIEFCRGSGRIVMNVKLTVRGASPALIRGYYGTDGVYDRYINGWDEEENGDTVFTTKITIRPDKYNSGIENVIDLSLVTYDDFYGNLVFPIIEIPYKMRDVIFTVDSIQVNSNSFGAAENFAHADQITITERDRITILGWAAQNISGLKEIVYTVDGKENVACSDLYRARPDVAAAFDFDEEYTEHTGFGFDSREEGGMMELLGIDELEAGEYHIAIKAIYDDGHEAIIKEFDLTVKEELELPSFLEIAEDVLNIVVDGATGPVYATPGEYISVRINLVNNPGISSLKAVVRWADGLRLVGAEYDVQYRCGDCMIHTPNNWSVADRNKQYTFNWVAPNDTVYDDVTYVDLLFFVEYDAEGFLPVTVECDPDDVFEGEDNNVEFVTLDGGVIAAEPVLAGDVDNDGRITNLDVVYLFRAVSGQYVFINNRAADVNGDGVVNNKDVIALFKKSSSYNR